MATARTINFLSNEDTRELAPGYLHLVKKDWQPVALVDFLHIHAKNPDKWACFGSL
jgi:hypothetical protein